MKIFEVKTCYSDLTELLDIMDVSDESLYYTTSLLLCRNTCRVREAVHKLEMQVNI